MPHRQTKDSPARRESVAGVRPDRATLFHLLFLSAAAFALYARTLWNGFAADDNSEVLQDRLIRSFANIPTFFAHSVWFYLGGKGDRYYRPLKLLAYSVEYHLFQLHPPLWHLANNFVHIAVVIAAYFLVRDLASRQLAFWTALWFAFHAIHVEAVAWIAGGNDLFCALALLVATWLYHRARSGASPLLHYGLSVAVFFAGLLSKETALIFLLLLLAYDFFYRRDSMREMRRAWQRYLPYFAALGVYLVLRWHALGGFAPDNPKNLLTRKEMFLTVPVLLVQYLWKALVPTDLRFWYVFEPTRALGWKPLAAIALVVALIAALFWLRRVQPLLSFALAWFLLFLLPVLDIPKLGENVFTERYLYIPTFGFCIFAGWIWLRLRELATRPLVRRAAYTGIVAVFAFYTVITLRRLPDWQDDLHLALKTAEQAPTAKNIGQIGYLYYQMGRFQDSIRYSQRAAMLDPGIAQIHNNLGSDFLALGRYDEALAEIQKAIDLEPDFAPYRTNLAVFYRATSQWGKAIEACRRGLALAPNDHALLTLLGLALWHDGQREQALDAYRRAIDAEPDRLDAYISLATGLYQLGQFDAAIGRLLAGLRVNPDSEDAYLVHYQLGAIYERKGLWLVAAQEYQQALQRKRDFSLARAALHALSAPPVDAQGSRVQSPDAKGIRAR